MAILGLTNDEQGNSLQRLPVAIKVAIALGPDPSKGRKAPQRLDHFIFLKKVLRGQDVAWEPDEVVTKMMQETYGTNPREIGIILLDDDPENVFRTNYEWWTNTECKCRGSLVQLSNGSEAKFGMQAIRRTDKHPEGELWPGNYKYADGAMKGKPVEGCGDGCPDLEAKRCKPSGDLHFILDRFPMLGAICRIHTTSYRSIPNIANAMMQIRQLTGGRLAGIRVMLTAQPEKIKYEDDKGKHTTTAHILSLRIDAPSMQKLIENMTETTKLFQETRKLLGGRRVEIIEDETEKAPEISAEFHPQVESDERPALPPKAHMPTKEELAQQAVVRALGRELGYNDAKINMMLGQRAKDLPQLEIELKELLGQNGNAEQAEGSAAVEAAAVVSDDVVDKTNGKEASRVAAPAGSPPRSAPQQAPATKKGENKKFAF